MASNLQGMNHAFRRFLYGAFVVLGFYYLLQAQGGEALANWGIALAFDPFDANQPWKERPRWQRMWLLVHLSALLVVVGMWMAWSEGPADASRGFWDGFKGN